MRSQLSVSWDEAVARYTDSDAAMRTAPRKVDADLFLAVYDTQLEFERTVRLRDATIRARFMVRASTGGRSHEIMRAKRRTSTSSGAPGRVRDGTGG